jgi:hypothetical protein
LICSGGNLLDEVILSYEMCLDMLPQPPCVPHWNEHVPVPVNPSADMIHDQRSIRIARVELIFRQIRVKGHEGDSGVNGISPTARGCRKIYLSSDGPTCAMDRSKTVAGAQEQPTALLFPSHAEQYKFCASEPPSPPHAQHAVARSWRWSCHRLAPYHTKLLVSREPLTS